LDLSFPTRIALLNECINVCNVLPNRLSPHLTKAVAVRAFNRIVKDPTGKCRPRLDISKQTDGFPLTIRNAVCKNGFIDKWAEKLSYNASMVFHKSNNVDLVVLENEDCCNPQVEFRHFEYNSTPNHKKSFWFISITNSFSDSFWDQLTTGINELRFCTGLGGKHNAYVRCSSLETDAVFSTGG
jgi:hypothetical protein